MLSKNFAAFFAMFLMMVTVNGAIASDAVDIILSDAENECKSFENGSLSYERDLAITLIDITGNGEMDEVVDSSAFHCSSAASLFCGTGGCAVIVIADGAAFSFLAKAWSVRQTADKPVLAMETHWSECDYTSYCFEKFIWNGTSFDSLGTNVEDPNVVMGLHDGAWILQDLGDGKVTISFNTDGTLSGQGPCNRYHGSYEADYPEIKFGPIASTRMACANSADEYAYFEQLAKVSGIGLAQGRLKMIQSNGATLTFSR